MQALDLIGFSSQYFFLMGLFCCSLSMNIFASMILLRSEDYHFLGDPAMPIISLATLIMCQVLKMLTIKMMKFNFTKFHCTILWQINHIQGTMVSQLFLFDAVSDF